MKKILVACGNGIATSTVVASKIRDFLSEKGVNVVISQCKLMEVNTKAQDYDLVVTTGQFDSTIGSTPVLKGMALLLGIGANELLEEIYEIVK